MTTQTPTQEMPTVSIDSNDAAFLAQLVYKYMNEVHENNHLRELAKVLNGKAGC